MKKNIIFLWHEIPNYAAYQLSYIIKKSPHNFYVITNRIINDQIKKILKKKIFSLQNYNEKKKIKKIILNKKPQILFSSGWRYKYIQHMIKLIKKNNNNTKIISMIDNNFQNNLRQKLGKIYFKVFLKDLFDFFWVPGNSSKKLLNYYGVKNKYIFKNLYSVNEKIFFNKNNIENRKDNFVFVGQCIGRKNFYNLANLFLKNFYGLKNKLIVITTTPKKIIKKNYLSNEKINFYFNLSPKDISKKLNENKFFVLPSKIDHWPLAFLEALSTGNICIVSKNLGNIHEFGKSNLTILKKTDDKSINIALNLVRKYSKKKLIQIATKNFKLSKNFYLNNSYTIFKKILKNCE